MLEGGGGSERSKQEVPTEAGSEEPQPRGAALAEGGWRCSAQTWLLGAGVGGSGEASSLGNRLRRIE